MKKYLEILIVVALFLIVVGAIIYLQYNVAFKAPHEGFAKREATSLCFTSFSATTISSVVFFNHTATIWTRCCKGSVVSWNRIAVVFFGFFDNMLSHLSNFFHKVVSRKFTLLD